LKSVGGGNLSFVGRTDSNLRLDYQPVSAD
jgi:hypothetical protein